MAAASSASYAPRVTSLADPLSFAHGPTWRNRFTLAPLTNVQSHADGSLSAEEHAWLVARARGGFGRVLTAAAYVAPAGRTWAGELGVAAPSHLPGLTRLAEALAAEQTVSAVQLHHGGRRAVDNAPGSQRVAPWNDPEKGAVALDTPGVAAVVRQFADAAVLSEEAGFQGVEVHAAHGYLLGQFLDPRSNHRTDQYGGTPANRLRVVLEVLTAIREATGPDFQVGIRLTPEGYGIPLTEGREHAREVFAAGLVDYVEMSMWDVFMEPRRDDSGGRIIDRFLGLDRGDARLGVTGKVLSTADAQWCLDQGADFVGVGIGAILHHDFARRALDDPAFEVRERPVTRRELAEEFVSPLFVDYLAEGWDDLVTD